MSKAARFGVDPKLTTILGDTYSSSEKALCELIDNAWDADASVVRVRLPEPMTSDPITIEDDGTGMTDTEVREIYLTIANDRMSRSKDARSHGKRRLVKGRKGIGKFSGLAAADTMVVETKARGMSTRVTIEKSLLLDRDGSCDLESIDLPLVVEKTNETDHGTTITLSNLDQTKSFPLPETLRSLLVRSYSREPDFTVFVNDEPLIVSDMGGETNSVQFKDPTVGDVKVSWTIADKPLPKSEAGFVFKVGGKIVGTPSFCGIEEAEDIPEKIRNRIWGEIEADGLDKHVTADWGDIVENSLPLQAIKVNVNNSVSSHIREVCSTEVNAARARLAKTIKARIEMLPEYRRSYAEDAVERVIQKYFPDGDDKIKLLVGLILDAIEHDEYFLVCEKIASAANSDISTIAECLSEFGLVDLAVMGKQAKGRLSMLDEFERLAGDPKTLEADIHKSIERNLWVLGPQYSIISSNKTLAKIIDDYLQKGGSKARAKHRPDLFLGQSVDNRKLLIEFKRPKDKVGRDAEAQVKKYRDDLTASHGTMEIMVLGGSVDASLRSEYSADTQFRSYMSVIADARSQLEWMLKELTQ